MMETMKEVSSHGGENEKFKPYLIVKGKIENRGVAVDIVLYIYIFFFSKSMFSLTLSLQASCLFLDFLFFFNITHN